MIRPGAAALALSFAANELKTKAAEKTNEAKDKVQDDLEKKSE
jgi:hypothetical protein